MFNMKMLRGLMGFVLMCIALTANSQKKADTVDILGEFNDKVNGKLTLQYKKVGGGRMEFDSARVVDGRFGFKKATNEPIILTMSLETKKTAPGRGGSLNYESFYLNPGKVKMSGSSQLKETTITGSGTIGNNEYKAYSDSLDSYISRVGAVNRTVPAGLPAEVKEAQWKRNTDSIYLIRDEQLFLRQIKDHPQSLLSVLAMNQYASEPVWRPRKKIQPEVIEKLLATLPLTYRSYPSLLALKEELKASKVTGIGKPILDFSLKDTAGRTVSLSDYKGQYVFLDFWASWCVPCRKENPNVKKAYAAYKDKGFTVLSVSLDKAEARKAWLDAIKMDGIGEWKHVVDEKAFDGEIARRYFIKSIPTNFLIGPDGKFIARNLYGKDLDKELEKIFHK